MHRITLFSYLRDRVGPVHNPPAGVVEVPGAGYCAGDSLVQRRELLQAGGLGPGYLTRPADKRTRLKRADPLAGNCLDPMDGSPLGSATSLST